MRWALLLALGAMATTQLAVGTRAIAQVSPSEDDGAPVLLMRFVKPVYPRSARQAGIGGKVTVRLIIQKDGTMGSPEVTSWPTGGVEPSATYAVAPELIYSQLRQAAIDSARELRFRCQGVCLEKPYTATYVFTVYPQKADPCCCTSTSAPPDPDAPLRGETLVSQRQLGRYEIQVTVKVAPGCMCPDQCPSKMKVLREQSKFRSPKCLYLWKCGRHIIILY
jgi:hypothetical protein